MKRLFYYTIYAAALFISTIFSSCVKEASMPESNEDETITLRITANLPEDPQTRLNYYESGNSLKTTWSSGDRLTANASPGSTDYVYIFDLVEGANTSTGVFECTIKTSEYLPQNLTSDAWTIYFPGYQTLSESDYFRISYVAQIQTGNNNLDHLKYWHYIRFNCTAGEKSTFKDTFIDLSGNDLEESACMKFQLSGLPYVIPTAVSLKYTAPSGSSSKCFHIYNYIDEYYPGGAAPNPETTDILSIALTDFTPCTEANVYMMMSNYPVNLKSGGELTITVKDNNGKEYICKKKLKSDVTLEGGRLHRISGSTWTKVNTDDVEAFDGLATPEKGVFVLQEATMGTGTDIIIMGDGFSKNHFGQGGNYEDIMLQAYEDMFSVEPFRSLKDYFNVYYINAVSVDDHDAQPLNNGAVQGNANTVFNTKFKQNSTNITGNSDAVESYAKQAIRHKGGRGGTKCTSETEVESRVNRSLMIVMANVACHAGTCQINYGTKNDYCPYSSIAYCALNTNLERRRLTLAHEAGGHGFGKLADEYGGSFINSFSIGDWNNLINDHGWGVYRNVNEHWTAQEKADGWSKDFRDTYTDESNVYWTELLAPDYDYTRSEGLGIYRGAFTYDNLYCRPTYNSLMRDQFSSNGNYFNAISRWAIWYRLMKLTGSTSATDFKSSLNEFIAFDNTLTIDMSSTPMTRTSETEGLLPLAPPVLIEID